MGLPPGDSQGRMLIVVVTVFEAFAITAVVLRLWSRRLKKTSLLLNDYLVLLALFCATGLVTMILIAVVAGGLGQHIDQVITKPQELIVFGKVFIGLQPFWVSALTAVKISILDLYISIFRNPRFRKFCYVGMVVCILFFIYDILVAFLICKPLAFNWNKAIPGGHCGNEVAVYITAQAVNFVIDVSLAILPMPVLWKLQMPLRKKVEISILFSLGTLICIISLLRFAFWRLLLSKDATYSTVLLNVFTILEPLLGIVLACLPIMRPAGIKIANSYALSWVKPLVLTRSGSDHGKEVTQAPNEAFKTARVRNFQRLQDDITLSTLRGEVEGYPVESQQAFAEHTRHSHEDVKPDAINVTKGYDVHSSPTRGEELV